MKQPLLPNTVKDKNWHAPQKENGKFTMFCCGIMTCLCLSIALIMFLIFVGNENWYLNAAKTVCTITKHNIIEQTCGGDHPYPCYEGDIEYNYHVAKKSYHHDEIITAMQYLEKDVEKELAQYPVGSNQSCWYEVSDPKDVTLIEKDNYSNYVASLVFMSIGLGTCVLAMGAFIYVRFC